jgi:endoglucanase
MNDSADPFYTRLAAGAYAAKKPKGQPCDASTNCNPNGAPKLPLAGKIAIAVVVTVVGLVILGLAAWWVRTVRRNRGSSTVKAS